MAHEIEIRDGQASMMYAGEMPWHGLGTAVEKEVTANAAIKLAGLDWVCVGQPIYLKGQKEVDGIPVIGSQVPGNVAVVRTLDNKVLGLVSDKYTIIQNRECFDFLDEIIGSGEAIYHTAGSLFGGRVVFCTVKLPKDAKVGDDLINKYLLMRWAHDRTSAVHIRWTPIRVVCNNTLSVALGKHSDCQISIRHTPNYKDKVEDARRVLRLADQYYATMEKQFNVLLEEKFTEEQTKNFVEMLFPQNGDKLAGITRKRREKVVELSQTGRGIAAIKGTKWAIFNAVAEYADHFAKFHAQKDEDGEQTKSVEETRFVSITGGTGSHLKQRALDLLIA